MKKIFEGAFEEELIKKRQELNLSELKLLMKQIEEKVKEGKLTNEDVDSASLFFKEKLDSINKA